MKEQLIFLIYTLLDKLKQRSPFLWAAVQAGLWTMFGLISTEWINFKGEEIVLVFLGGLISSVGSRTSKKLSESKIKINPDTFRKGVENFNKEIEKVKDTLNKKDFDIVKNFLPKSQYVDEITKKNQIILHHTAGGSAQSSIDWWLTKPERVATHFLIERDGTVIQTLPLECWAFALNVGTKDNRIPREFKKKDKELNQKAIQIELCSWGALTKKGDKYFNWANTEFRGEVETLEYTFRKFEYFEKYTEPQLRSLKKLLEQLSENYQIPITELTFDVNVDALKGKPGIYTHVNYSTLKSDCYPSNELIDLINDLKNVTA